MTNRARPGIAVIGLLMLFTGAAMSELIELPEPEDNGISLYNAIEGRRSRRSYGDGEVTLEQAAELLWSASGITSPNGRYRAAPSAGATYPVDTYLLAGKVKGLKPGIYRYIENYHALELVKEGDYVSDLADASLGQSCLRDAPAVICLFGIYERTARRYGDRAVRYVHMEIGHIGQNIYLATEALGLSTVAVGAFYDDKVSELFGVQGAPLYLMPFGPRAD